MKNGFYELEQRQHKPLTLPTWPEFLKEAEQIFLESPIESPEFCRMMQHLIPRIIVYPVQPLDGGQIVLRADLTVLLVRLNSATEQFSQSDLLTYPLTVDLFEPPQRVAILEQVVTLTRLHCKERDIAAELCVTQPAVQHAKRLARLMEFQGVEDPYSRLTVPSGNSGRNRRHLHVRYRFDPLSGFPENSWLIN